MVFMLSNWENLYKIHHDSDFFFFDTSDIINKHNQIRNCYLSLLFLYQLEILKEVESFFNNLICFVSSSSISLEDINLAAIFFHVSDFLRLFVLPFKYVLILLRYSSIHSVLYPSLLLSYSI